MTAVGPGVTDVKVGDRVAWTGVPGAYAQVSVVPADRLVKLPDGLTFKDGAAAMLQGLTAHYLDHVDLPAQAGRRLPDPGGGRRRGPAAVPDGEDARRHRDRHGVDRGEGRARQGGGADHVILYTKQDFEAEVKRITGGAGVHVVYDGVGQTTFDKGINCLRPRGLMVLFGAASGPVPPLDLQILNARGSLFVTRPSLNHHIATRAELLERAGDVLGWIRDGKVKLRVEHQFPLADAAEAHRALEGRKTTGKILLIPA